MVWRYDPIFLTEKYTTDWHEAAFRELLGALAPYTERCAISFLDLYQKTEQNMKALGLLPMTTECMEDIAARFSRAARDSGIDLQTCAEAIDFGRYGIQHRSCNDKYRIERIFDASVDDKKDSAQRQDCNCLPSVDIGQYNTCPHLCRYCYANFEEGMVRARVKDHHEDSTMLSGYLSPAANVTERKIVHLKMRPRKEAAFTETSLF